MADIHAYDGTVVETEKLPLRRDTVTGRQQDWPTVLWILYALDQHRAGKLRIRPAGGGLVQFRWDRPSRNIQLCHHHLLDLGWSADAGAHVLLEPAHYRTHTRTLAVGAGRLLTADNVARWIRHGEQLTPHPIPSSGRTASA
ncbi:hypothetical protein ABT246_42125 [Streptomyces sp. NPDC001553]|uniref:hypothetical protein n=1 Tax=Streptomyces sp. NPDC001553 TaxID=3154385 RepID=UPI00332B40E5